MKKYIKLVFGLFFFFLIFSPFLVPRTSESQISQEEYIENFDIEGGRFLEIEEYKTYYIDINQDAEKTILLIHGFGGSATNWLSVIPQLADEGYRVVAVDLKGFGLSDKKIDGDFSHKSQAKFLNSFVKELNLKNISIVGHSMGGNIATMYVQEYPAEVEKLVLVNAAVLQSKDFDEMRSYVLKILDFPIVKEYVRVFLKIALNQERINTLFESAMYMPEEIEVKDPYFINPVIFSNWEYVVIKMSSVLHMNILEKSVSEIKAPVSIIWGEKDTWTPLAQGERLAQDFGGVNLDVLENTGHLPMFENSELFFNTLKKALD